QHLDHGIGVGDFFLDAGGGIAQAVQACLADALHRQVGGQCFLIGIQHVRQVVGNTRHGGPDAKQGRSQLVRNVVAYGGIGDQLFFLDQQGSVIEDAADDNGEGVNHQLLQVRLGGQCRAVAQHERQPGERGTNQCQQQCQQPIVN